MAKRSAKRSSHTFEDDEFNDNDMMEEEVEEEEDFEDEYGDENDSEDEEEEEEEERPVRRPVKKKAAARKRVSEPAASKEVRLKAFWSVYSQNFQRVETFEYGEKEAAEKKAAELTESKKMLHFVKLDKKVIET